MFSLFFQKKRKRKKIPTLVASRLRAAAHNAKCLKFFVISLFEKQIFFFFFFFWDDSGSNSFFLLNFHCLRNDIFLESVKTRKNDIFGGQICFCNFYFQNQLCLAPSIEYNFANVVLLPKNVVIQHNLYLILYTQGQVRD